MNEKTLSCGALILTDKGALALLPTGRKLLKGNFDISKGQKEKRDFTPYHAVLRETLEECNLDIEYASKRTNVAIHDFGRHAYKAEKDLHLFVIEIEDIDKVWKEFGCNSYFEDPRTGVECPEMKGFKFVNAINWYFKSLQKYFTELRKHSELFEAILDKHNIKY